MKRKGLIFEQLCTYQTLVAAFARVRRGKCFRKDVLAFEANLHENLSLIRDELEHETFQFGAYHYFMIYDPKKRRIAAASVRERVVHHAIIALCGERLERALIDRSYACRVGKGQWAAVAEAKKLARQSSWCLKIDIKSFFDTIDHKILFRLLTSKFKDHALLSLFRQLISSYETEPGKGLPIGNLTSQYFANLYLDPLDRMIDNFCFGNETVAHLRYMDDLLIFGSREALRCLGTKLPAFLSEILKLIIKEKGGLHPISRGVDFLGTRIFPWTVRLARTSKKRFAGKLRHYTALYRAGHLTDANYQNRLTQLFAFVNHCDSRGFRRKMVSENGQRELSSHTRRLLEQQQQRRLCDMLPFRVSEQQLQQQHQPKQQQRLLGLPVGVPPCSSRMQEPYLNRSFSGSWGYPRQIDTVPEAGLVGYCYQTPRSGFLYTLRRC